MSDIDEFSSGHKKVILKKCILLEETIAEKHPFYNIDEDIQDNDVRDIIRSILHMVRGGR